MGGGLKIWDFVNFFLEQRATVSYGSYGELRLENTRLYKKSYGGGDIFFDMLPFKSYGELRRATKTYGYLWIKRVCIPKSYGELRRATEIYGELWVNSFKYH